MGFGRNIEGNHVAYWGARAIYQGYQRNYFIDVLADRQTGDNVSDAFLFWLNNRALPWLRAEVRRQGLSTDSDQVLSLTEYKYHLEATPNRSYGYLYIGAVERPVVQDGVWHNTSIKKDERILVTDDHRLVWGVDHDPPEPGTRGVLNVNNLGPGILVGYQDEPYSCPDARLLNLRVKLDSPPEWWVKQTKARDLAEWVAKGRGYGCLKQKYQTALDNAEDGRRVYVAENVTCNAPSKVFTRDGMAAYREWKAKYELPLCVCWDGDFKVDSPVAA